MAGGRPTKYGPGALRKARKYFVDGHLEEEVFPTIAGLALYLGISRETVRDWATHEDKAEFSGTVKLIMAKQEQQLVRNGALGTYNPTITKLLLANHGHADKSESTTDNRHSFGSMSDEALEEIVRGALRE